MKIRWTAEDDARLRELMPTALETAGGLNKAAKLLESDFPDRSWNGISARWRFLQVQDEEKELWTPAEVVDGRNPEEALFDQLRKLIAELRQESANCMARICELEAENAELKALVDGIVNFKRRFGYNVNKHLSVEIKKESGR